MLQLQEPTGITLEFLPDDNTILQIEGTGQRISR